MSAKTPHIEFINIVITTIKSSNSCSIMMKNDFFSSDAKMNVTFHNISITDMGVPLLRMTFTSID